MPSRGEVPDRFCDHAAVCPCARDRNLRHYATARVFYEAAQKQFLKLSDDVFHPKPCRARKSQTNFQRDCQPMPTERLPLHPGGLWWTSSRLGRLCWSPGSPDSPSDINLELAQRISSSLHRDSARAILRRLRLVPSRYDPTPIGPDDWRDEPDTDAWSTDFDSLTEVSDDESAA